MRRRADAGAQPTAVADAGLDSVWERSNGVATGCPARDPVTDPRPRGHAHTDTVRGQERWRAADSPHRVPYGLEVMPGGVLEIEPCARVEVGEGRAIVVRREGRLQAAGTPEGPIYLGPVAGAEEAVEGRRWAGVTFAEGASVQSALAWVTLDGAGLADPARGEPAALRVGMAEGLSMRGVEIARWSGYALGLVGSGRVVSSGVLGLRDASSAMGAVAVDDVDAVASLPRLRWSGAAAPAGQGDVRVMARQRVVHGDARWSALGARYRVRSGARVMVGGASGRGALTLAAGVEIAFEAGAELVVGLEGPGALRAEGQLATSPVRLVSVDAGATQPSWHGVFFGVRTVLAESGLRGVVLRGAGLRARRAMLGCEADPAPSEPDAAMVTIEGVAAQGLLREMRFEVGPPRGYAVAQGGDIAGDFLNLTDPRWGLDAAGSGAGCVQRWPMVRGRCDATPRCH